MKRYIKPLYMILGLGMGLGFFACSKENTTDDSTLGTTVGTSMCKVAFIYHNDKVYESFKYDQAGRLSTIVRYEQNGPDTVNLVYNSAGQLYRKYFTQKGGDAYIPSYTEYIYNGNTLVKTMLYQADGSNNYRMSGYDELQIGADGKMAGIKHYTINAGTEQYASNTVFERDSKGNITKMTQYDAKGNVIKSGQFTYDSNRNPLAPIANTFEFSTYDSPNNVATETYTDIGNGNSNSGTHHTWQYDPKGDPTVETSQNSDGTQSTSSWDYSCSNAHNTIR